MNPHEAKTKVQHELDSILLPESCLERVEGANRRGNVYARKRGEK